MSRITAISVLSSFPFRYLDSPKYHSLFHILSRKFIIKVGKEAYEEVMGYNEIIEHLEAESKESILWKFRRIISHEGPLKADDEKWNGCSYNVQVEWENEEVTMEPLNIIGADSPVVCAVYAKENNLLDTPGWKRFKRIANR